MEGIAKHSEGSKLVEPMNLKAREVEREGVGSDVSSEDEEELFNFNTTVNNDTMDSLNNSYTCRPNLCDITFPHKFYPKK